MKSNKLVPLGVGFLFVITFGYYFGYSRGHSSAIESELVTAKVIAPRYRIKPAQEAIKTVPVPESVELKSGWYVQLTAERQMQEAVKYQAGLKSYDIETRIDELIAGGKSFFRVLTGPYNNREMAKNFSLELNKKSEGKIRPFVVFLK